MEELFYIPSLKVNSKVADTVVYGHHIEIDEITYQRVSKKPKGRSILRKITNITTNQTITIYS